MNKKVSLILLSAIFGASTVNCMEKAKAFGGAVKGTTINAARKVDGFVGNNPYWVSGGALLAGAVAADGLRKFPVACAIGRKISSVAKAGKDKTVASASSAYQTVRHPVESTQAIYTYVKDGVRHPRKNPRKAIVTGVMVGALSTEAAKKFPTSCALGRGVKALGSFAKTWTVKGASKVGKIQWKELGPSAAGLTKHATWENALKGTGIIAVVYGTVKGGAWLYNWFRSKKQVKPVTSTNSSNEDGQQEATE